MGFMQTKTGIIWALFFSILLLTSPAGAQTKVSQFDQINIDIWPDYDQPAVLVLITAELPADVPLPATVQFNLPVEPNAVASVTTTDDMLNTPYTSQRETNTHVVTVETNHRVVRIEYYYSYQRTGDTIQFEYQWLGGTAADDLTVLFREPVGATNVTPESQFEDMGVLADGQRRHSWQVGPVEANQTLSAAFNYSMPTTLSADALSLTKATNTKSSIVPIMIAAVGGFIVGLGAMWFWNDRQTATRPRRRSPKLKTKGFCPKCGDRIQAGDAFCRQCGGQTR